MVRFSVRESLDEVSRICNTGDALPVPDAGLTLAHCTSVRAVHEQFPADVRLKVKLPPRDVTCPGTPVAVVLHVDGLGEGEDEGPVGEDVPLLPLSLLLHAPTSSSNKARGMNRTKENRIIAG